MSVLRRHWPGKTGLLLFFAFFSSPGFSQQAELDSIIRTIEFRKDSIRSIFQWVITEMEYDTRQLLLVNGSSTYGVLNENVIREAINRKKGICLHYAELFNALVKRAGYESYVIEGYTRQGPSDDRYGHAWNAVKTGGQWFLYDPTWASGYVNAFVFTRRSDYQWYKVSPAKFVETHIPFDPIWQLLNPPLTHDEIRNGTFQKTVAGDFRFQDSIRGTVQRTEQERVLASLQRIKKMGIPNSPTRQYVQGLELYEKNTRDYQILRNTNMLLNRAISTYNEYVHSKNHQFKKPLWTDKMLTAFPEKLKAHADSSNKLLNTVSTTNVQIALYQAQLKKQIAAFVETADTEAVFIQKYLSTWKPLRIQNFYKK
jgi:hypothetical protein